MIFYIHSLNLHAVEVVIGQLKHHNVHPPPIADEFSHLNEANLLNTDELMVILVY